MDMKNIEGLDNEDEDEFDLDINVTVGDYIRNCIWFEANERYQSTSQEELLLCKMQGWND
jgi:hypothetical protein